MKIKKVDDKPMVIHTKQKAKLHTHEPKHAAIKGSNVYTVDRDPIKKKADNGKYRKSTVHQVQKKGMFSKYRTETFVVGPFDHSIRTQGEREELTLFTCAEKGTKRFVVKCFPASEEGAYEE